MGRKPGPKPKPRRARDVEYDFDDENPGLWKRHVIIAVFLFAIVGLFYLSYSAQAGMLGVWFLSNSKLFLGTVGFFIFPIFLALLGIIYVLYRNNPVQKSIPIGTLMLLLGLFTALYTINPSAEWSGFLGGLIGQPLLEASGTYISTLLSAMFAVTGFMLLPRGKTIMEGFGFVIQKNTSALFSKASGLVARKSKDEELDEEDYEYEEEEAEDDYEEEESSDETEYIQPPERKQSPAQEKPIDTTPKKPSLPSSPYIPPSLSLLAANSGKASAGDIQEKAARIKKTLENFNIHVEMDEISTGPSITRYTMKPAQGLKLSRISQLHNELSLALAAHPIRIEAPIPGKSLVGIEIPNSSTAMVGLRTLLEESQFQKSSDPLFVAMGRGVSGKPYFANIAKIPHLLIAGTTGSGKSVAVQNLILSLLYKNGPDNLKFILVDPKRVELTLYNGIPHLLTPVIKDAKKTITALRWAGKEMERRYGVLEQNGVRDINSYHRTVVTPAYEAAEKRIKAGESEDDIDLPERMPYIVIVIDELADIMHAYPRELESGIVRLAQMSRAVGIHLIISTQRPSVNVITGLIKANVPGRIALRVASQIDSRTILDSPGAERLLGAGDMLFLGEGMNKAERIQSAYVTEDEIKKIVSSIITQNKGFLPELIDIGDGPSEGAVTSQSYGESFSADEEDDDDLYPSAKDLVIQTRIASTSFLQRKLRIGYSRASRLIDILEERGVVGPPQGSKPRDVLIGRTDDEDEVEDPEEEDYDDEETEDE